MTATFDKLIATGHELARVGLSNGSSGNISVRTDGRVYMTGTGADLGKLRRSNISVLSENGDLIDGPAPSKEVFLHLALYWKNPEHRAVVHVHSPYAVAASCLEPWSPASALPPLTPYFVMRVGQTPLIPYRTPGDPELGALLLASPHSFRAALLANHGQIVSGDGLLQAAEAAVELEDAARITLLTAGMPRRLLAAEEIDALTAKWGTSWEHLHALAGSR